MLRKAAGFKAAYHSLTLMVAPDFDEWRIFVKGPAVMVQGGRQFTEAKAKEHVVLLAAEYFREFMHQDVAPPEVVEWVPFEDGEWLNWKP